jgi:hypothetical protein
VRASAVSRDAAAVRRSFVVVMADKVEQALRVLTQASLAALCDAGQAARGHAEEGRVVGLPAGGHAGDKVDGWQRAAAFEAHVQIARGRGWWVHGAGGSGGHTATSSSPRWIPVSLPRSPPGVQEIFYSAE